MITLHFSYGVIEAVGTAYGAGIVSGILVMVRWVRRIRRTLTATDPKNAMRNIRTEVRKEAS